MRLPEAVVPTFAIQEPLQTIGEGRTGSIPALVVADDALRRAMACTRQRLGATPTARRQIVGITGTKGAVHLRHHATRAILDANDAAQAAILGSIDTFDGVGKRFEPSTPPEAPDLWRHATCPQLGPSYLVMEVSSQALKYDVGAQPGRRLLLNIGRDHISPAEHPDFEDYFSSKLRIFDQFA